MQPSAFRRLIERGSHGVRELRAAGRRRSVPRLARCAWLAALLCVSIGPLAAQSLPKPDQSPRELLNSERIEQRFGSYGIDVLESGPEFRVSSLYSVEDETKVCRTFAVVKYPARVDPSFAAAHEAILDGGSIGAVFAARGWRVRKSHRYFGTMASSPKLEALMGGLPPSELAVHFYVLEVSKDGAAFDYAAIVEVHHPQYLALQDLHGIYGTALDETDDGLVETMLRVTQRKIEL